MRKKPYLIDGLIGNGNMLLSFTREGVIQRLNWPRIDYIDQVNHQWAGVLEKNDTKTAFFHDATYTHEQYYEEDSNILVTEHHSNEYKIKQVDFVLPNKDTWVRDYHITNKTDEEKEVTFVYYSESALEGQEKFQTTKFDMERDSLVHYYRSTAMAISASKTIKTYQAGKAKEQAEINLLEGRVILNHPEGAMTVDMELIQPEETKQVSLYISLACSEKEALTAVHEAKKEGAAELRNQTAAHWSGVLNKRICYGIKNERTEHIYKRSILTFHLLQNKETGAFIAGPEVDDDYDFSGGYAYCWGRDAAFIASAVDAAGYHELVDKFYQFMIKIQSEDGSWEQRHYTDGVLGPTWGLQIDETGSILWGMNQHYQLTKNEEFREQVWPAVKKGAGFLCRFIDPETNLPLPSKDLWEKRDGEHLYSAAAVYGGLLGAADFAMKADQEDTARFYREKASTIKEAVVTIGWNAQEGRFARSLKLTVPEELYKQKKQTGIKVLDQINRKNVKEYMIWEDLTPDISLLGLSYPFNMLDASDAQMRSTARVIEETCASKKIGGIERFPGDVYIGGNPWIISTLWLSMYKAKISELEEAEDLFGWATKSANHLGLLPEQIDKETGEPAWVMPLTWSHAMYVLAIKELSQSKSSFKSLKQSREI